MMADVSRLQRVDVVFAWCRVDDRTGRERGTNMGKLRELMKRGWQSPVAATVILFVLGLSPVGFAIPFFALSTAGVCGGALGSGVYCHLPQGIEWYFETLAVILEVSCFFFGLCVPWLLAAVAVWVGFFAYLGRAVYRVFRPI